MVTTSRGLGPARNSSRSEEHTSELQSHSDLVCRLLLEKKKKSHRVTKPDSRPEYKRAHTLRTSRRFSECRVWGRWRPSPCPAISCRNSYRSSPGHDVI